MSSKTNSRFFDFTGKQVKEGNTPKNGPDIRTFDNKFGFKKITVIFYYKNGYLHSEDDIPAIQCEDGHTEYWTMGKLDNTRMDIYGELMPAVVSADGSEEYWVNGKKISK